MHRCKSQTSKPKEKRNTRSEGFLRRKFTSRNLSRQVFWLHVHGEQRLVENQYLKYLYLRFRSLNDGKAWKRETTRKRQRIFPQNVERAEIVEGKFFHHKLSWQSWLRANGVRIEEKRETIEAKGFSDEPVPLTWVNRGDKGGHNKYIYTDVVAVIPQLGPTHVAAHTGGLGRKFITRLSSL